MSEKVLNRTAKGKILDTAARGIDRITEFLSWIAFIALGMIILLMVAHVIGRMFHIPIIGVIELVQIMMVVVGFIAIPFAAMKGAHITMDLVTKRLPKRPQMILGIFASLLGFGIGGLITYQSALIALDYARHLDKATPLLSIPNAPFRIIAVLGFLLLCLILLKDIFRPLSPENKNKEDTGK